MLYILGHRPDEFGLVPDREGFVTFKELLWAIHEEPGWGYVREGHFREVLLGKDRALFETQGEERIRAAERHWRHALDEPASDLPKILFVGVRRRAHPRVMEKGLSSPGFLVLSSGRDIALRMARRRDRKPVILEVLTATAREQGVVFHPFGDLFLADHIPASCLSGPPVTEEMRQALELARAKKEKPPAAPDFTPGSFVLDLSRDPARSRRAKGKKRKGWKEEARKIRRGKG